MIAVRRERLGHGKWRNNVYVLLDRGQWKSPEDIKAPWLKGQKRHQPRDNNDRTKGHHSPIKDTHKKDTHIKDTGEIDIFSLNEEGEWMGRGNMRPQVDEVKLGEITGAEDTIPNKYEKQQESVKRKLAEVKAELSERLGWEKKDDR